MSLQIKKHSQRFCCPAFLEFIRTLDCEDCFALGLKQKLRTTASHLISIKWATGSDALAVPQCLEHHPQSSGQAAVLLSTHGVDVEVLHRKLWKSFLSNYDIDFPVLTQEHFEQVCGELCLVEKSFSRRKNR